MQNTDKDTLQLHELTIDSNQPSTSAVEDIDDKPGQTRRERNRRKKNRKAQWLSTLETSFDSSWVSSQGVPVARPERQLVWGADRGSQTDQIKKSIALWEEALVAPPEKQFASISDSALNTEEIAVVQPTEESTAEPGKTPVVQVEGTSAAEVVEEPFTQHEVTSAVQPEQLLQATSPVQSTEEETPVAKSVDEVIAQPEETSAPHHEEQASATQSEEPATQSEEPATQSEEPLIEEPEETSTPQHAEQISTAQSEEASIVEPEKVSAPQLEEASVTKP
jgi:hypothetical protein